MQYAELGRLVDEGKIRFFGLSNETPWGTMRFLQAAELEDLPRPVSIQNPYHGKLQRLGGRLWQSTLTATAASASSAGARLPRGYSGAGR